MRSPRLPVASDGAEVPFLVEFVAAAAGRAGLPVGTLCAVIDVNRLARDARDGDREAMGRFLSTIQGDVWRFCAHLTRSDDADDLAQESLLRIVSHLHRWHGDSAMAWSLGVARNVCFDHLRRKGRRRTDPVPDLPTMGVTAAYGVVETMQLLDALPLEQREAIVLTQLIGLPYADAAEVMRVPVGTIRSRVARGRDSLADGLRQQRRRQA